MLAHRGREVYTESFTHGGGFYRNFFAALKAGAGEAGGLERLFITGVSERELNKGYADLHLVPFVAQYPDVGYGYVMEVKYLKRSGRADESVVAERLRGACEQLKGYLADEGLGRRAPSVRHVGLAVVFHGWELAACEAVEPGTDAAARIPIPAPPAAGGCISGPDGR